MTATIGQLKSANRTLVGFQRAAAFLKATRHKARIHAMVPPIEPEPFIEVTLKATGRGIPVGRRIQRAVWEEFAQREAGARRSDRRLAAALFEPTLTLLRRSALEQLALAGEDVEDHPELARVLVRLARERTSAVAAEINDTTTKWLDEERDPFERSRALSIGETESSWATHAAQEAVLRATGVKGWTWVYASRKSCLACKSLSGRRVRVGRDFVAKNGMRAKHPPLHPHCACTVE